MHALLVIDSLAGGGAQRQFVNLAVGLAARGHAVHVVTYAPLEHHLPEIRAAGVDYTCVGKRSRFDLSPAADLHRIWRAARHDVVVAFLRTPAVYAELARVAAPSMRLIVSERSGVSRDGLRRSDRLAGLGHVLATHVTANSDDYLRRLARALPFLAGKSSVIRNGIEERFFALGRARLGRPRPDDAGGTGGAVVRDGTSPSDGGFAASDVGPTVGSARDVAAPLRLCVVAARASVEKGLIVLVEALVHLDGRGEAPVQVDWVGPFDPDDETVRDANARLDAAGLADRWRWRGRFDDVTEAFADRDALVLCSLFEGAANTLCEAMCAALPVIATDVADNRAVLEDGDAGLLCPADDAPALADAIARLGALPPAARRTQAERAFVRAEELFSMGRFVDRWEALCLDVAER